MQQFGCISTHIIKEVTKQLPMVKKYQIVLFSSNTAMLNHFVSLKTVFYWEEIICKQIEILLTVWLSTPINKLPWCGTSLKDDEKYCKSDGTMECNKYYVADDLAHCRSEHEKLKCKSENPGAHQFNPYKTRIERVLLRWFILDHM